MGRTPLFPGRREERQTRDCDARLKGAVDEWALKFGSEGGEIPADAEAAFYADMAKHAEQLRNEAGEGGAE